ncbi:ZCHC3 protein, partial [Atractosteus spatula]|nr:ZCHC3 protein [Atractosteus spatula]MBN3314460.1 ZCHC3 protein [Atractosteus spatula]
APLVYFHVEPLFARELRQLVVHMFNPFVPDEDICFFLKRYVDIQGVGKKILDAGGYWTCKRKYMVCLRPGGPQGAGVVHPPATFSIRANNGYLYYSGQPTGCRKCGNHGHISAEFNNVVCRRCGVIGHVTAECRVGISCNLCGKQGHLYNTCPNRKRSYAEAAAAKAQREKIGESASVSETETERDNVQTGGEGQVLEESSGSVVMDTAPGASEELVEEGL